MDNGTDQSSGLPTRAEMGVTVVDFLRGHSAPCPSCEYDLRDLTSDICPECGTRLRLHLGRNDPVSRNWLTGFAILLINLGFPVLLTGIVASTYISRRYLFPNRKEGWAIIGLLILFLGLNLVWIRRRRWLAPLDQWPLWVIIVVGFILTAAHTWFIYRTL